MMKDDGLLIARALKAFADIANSLTKELHLIVTDSQFSSPLFTSCGNCFAVVESLCSNREEKCG